MTWSGASSGEHFLASNPASSLAAAVALPAGGTIFTGGSMSHPVGGVGTEAFGVLAAASDTSGTSTAFGYAALNANVGGQANIAIGANAALSTTGSSNTVVGFDALRTNGAGTENTAIGRNALRNSTTNYQTAIGTDALKSNTTGVQNVGIGRKALTANQTAQANVAVGESALAALISGGGCTAVGNFAGTAITTGGDNNAIGQNALSSLTIGTGNTADGSEAFQGLIDGLLNTGIGYAVGYDTGGIGNRIIHGTGNTFLGAQSGAPSAADPSYATAVGALTRVGASGTVAIGTDNTGVGASTSVANTIVFGTALHHTLLGVSAPALTVTTGLPYMPATAGTPTGVPAGPAGWAAFRYDTTAHKLWIYDGGWKGVVVA